MKAKRSSLGKNFQALLSEVTQISESVAHHTDGNLLQIPITQIQKGKYQPRKDFPEHELAELADSIRAQGIIQPIVVRSFADNQYEIIAGERRFRAAKMAGLETIPAILRELPDEAAIAMALIENIQRQDLNPIEEAAALQRLINEFDMTHEQVASAVGKSRTAVTNLLRLLSLTDQVKRLVEKRKLEMGHARALLSLPAEAQIICADKIVARDLSVREAEVMVRQQLQNNENKSNTTKVALAPETYDLQQKMTKRLETRVQIQQMADGRGKIIIKYKNAAQLQALANRLADIEPPK